MPLEGVTKPLVSVEFNAYGFDLRVTGLAGANYRCAVSDLHAEIVPGESSFMVPKSNKRVVVKLKVPHQRKQNRRPCVAVSVSTASTQGSKWSKPG